MARKKARAAERPFARMDRWNSAQVARFKEQGQRLPEAVAAMGPAAEALRAIAGHLVAEGDSWFDYLPGTDVIDCLRNNHRYRIDNYALAGDTLENMIYGTNINKRFQRVEPTIETVLRRLGEVKPKAFLFSGGGNDVAGETFESYLNHKESGLPTLRASYLGDMVQTVFRKYFEDLIAKVAVVSPDTTIITHGYGHTVPTGVGVDFLFVTFAGPWVRPALAKKGVFDVIEQRQAVDTVLDELNTMLASVAQGNPKFRFVDLRPMIDPDTDWVNELHLKNSAYARVAERIHQEIQAIP